MAFRLALLLALATSASNVAAASSSSDSSFALAPRSDAASPASNEGFISFPVKRGSRPSRTLTGRQTSASLVNEQDTSYLIELTFGSNNQGVKVAIDTGSDELFVDPNCSDSDFSSSEQKQCKATGTYDPSTSSSSKSLGTSSQITYGSGAVKLDYYTDSIGIPGAGKNMSGVQFGKATSTQDLDEGILGIGFGRDVNLNYSNFVDALHEQGLTATKAFSVGLGTSDTAGGAIVFGGVDTRKFSGRFASLAIQPPARGDIQRYAVQLQAIALSNGSATATYTTGALDGVVLDTGSSLCELPAAVVSGLAADLGAQEDQASGLLIVDCALRGASAAVVRFAFAGVTVEVPLSQFVLQDGQACILGAQTLQAGSGITALLGDSFLRSAYVVFDQTNMRIGMAQFVDCGTNVRAITAGGDDDATGFTGECASSTAADSGASGSGTGSAASSSSSSKSAAGRPEVQSAALLGLHVPVVVMVATALFAAFSSPF